jgi:hypothetical protein
MDAPTTLDDAGVAHIERLPEEAVRLVFQFFNATEILSHRRVCKYFREHLTGVAHLSFSYPTSVRSDTRQQHQVNDHPVKNNSQAMSPSHSNPIGQVAIRGKKEVKTMVEPGGTCVRLDSAGGSSDGDKRRWGSVRVKGRLPEPNVLPEPSDLRLENLPPLLVSKTGRHGVALRLEMEAGEALEQNDSDGPSSKSVSSSTPLFSYWQSLDLSRSICTISRTRQAGALGQSTMGDTASPSRRFSPSQRHPPTLVLNKPLLKRILCQLDLSSLRHLDSCSVKGCGSLTIVHLPPSLTALDASFCGVLRRIVLPFGQRVPCHALNLNGCLLLEASTPSSIFGAATSDVMRHLRELDMSSTNRLGHEMVAHALSLVQALEALSLRYVATDAALLALSQSLASHQSLRFLDVSFSANLSDSPCEVVVDAAPKLERLNLRACSNVSAAVYNTIPITLFRRINNSGGHVTESNSDADATNVQGRKNARKGDTIFFFES